MLLLANQPLSAAQRADESGRVTRINQGTKPPRFRLTDQHWMIRVDDDGIERPSDYEIIAPVASDGSPPRSPCIRKKLVAAILPSLGTNNVALLCSHSLPVIKPPKILERTK